MRNLAIAFAFVLFCAVGNTVQAQTATYNPETGNIVVANIGDLSGPLGSLEALGSGVPHGDADPNGGLFEAGDDAATWVWFFGAPTDSADLGPIFPAQLDEIAGADYGVGYIVAGSGATEFTPIPVSGYLPIPEPGTVALAGLGLLGLGLVRRRRG